MTRQLTSRQVLDRAMSEDELLVAVTDELTLRGYRWFHVRRSDRAQQMGHRGWPDVFAICDGLILVIELKTETGQVDPGQRVWLAEFERAGLDTRVLRPRDLAEFRTELGRDAR